MTQGPPRINNCVIIEVLIKSRCARAGGFRYIREQMRGRPETGALAREATGGYGRLFGKEGVFLVCLYMYYTTSGKFPPLYQNRVTTYFILLDIKVPC